MNWAHDDLDLEDFPFEYPFAGNEADSLDQYPTKVLAAVVDVIDLLDAEGFVIPLGGQSPPHPWMAPNLGMRVNGSRGTGSRQPLHSVAATEPSIVCLARHWATIAGLLRFTDQSGAVAAADGFRLRRLSDWVVPTGGNPADVYEYLARVCNVHCTFCYLYGNPESMAAARGLQTTDDSEIRTRLKYFNPASREALFHAQWEINEFLVDPNAHWLLPRLRERSRETFYFITNGSPLKKRMLDLLADIKPAHLIVSINSVDPDIRGPLMRERPTQTDTAISALQELAKRRIPFGLSVVAMPGMPEHALAHTVELADEVRAAFIRINLPGFTKEQPDPPDNDLRGHWHEVAEHVRRLRPSTHVPLMIIPSAFESHVINSDPLAATLIGTVPGSPASHAGLRPGDEILSVDGVSVRIRADATSLLLVSKRPQVIVRRGTDLVDMTLDRRYHEYPFDGHTVCKYLMPWGVVLAPSLTRSAVRRIRDIMRSVGAKSAWFATSGLMRPAAQALLERFDSELLDALEFFEPAHEFLGGNITVMDMATVGDVARSLESRIAEHGRPELVMLSSTGLSRHGRDLQGRHWGDLERYFGFPVRLVANNRFGF